VTQAHHQQAATTHSMKGRFLLLLLLLLLNPLTTQSLLEQDRVEEYHKRHHVWPLTDEEIIPSIPARQQLVRRRLEQIQYLASEHRWEAHVNTIQSAIAKNYTEYGWGLMRAPHVKELSQALYGTSVSSPLDRFRQAPLEAPDIAIETDDDELSWTGIPLQPHGAYGLRVYLNTSKLHMHMDERATHVISAIWHVGHDTQQPWPLFLEDLHGVTQAIQLQPGDLLLYESAKCWHGRPVKMNGNWYSSLFVHFYPRDLDAKAWESKLHHRVPPNWKEVPEDKDHSSVDRLEWLETFCWEPDCEHQWCAVADARVVEGPAPEGFLLTGNGQLEVLTVEADAPDEL